MTDDALPTLHDHYKDTFALIRDREKQRDRNFWALIGLFALLFLEVQYPASFRGSVGSITIAGAKVEPASLPLAALLTASWVLTLAVALTYCRVSINIERQYVYLHRLEDWISQRIGVTDLYRREGKAYLEGYPVFLNWAWFSYVVIFPAIAILAVLTLMFLEWRELAYSVPHKLVDTVVGASLLVSIVLYRVLPQITERIHRAQAESDASADDSGARSIE